MLRMKFLSKPEHKDKFLAICKQLYTEIFPDESLNEEKAPLTVYDWRNLFYEKRNEIALIVSEETANKMSIDVSTRPAFFTTF